MQGGRRPPGASSRRLRRTVISHAACCWAVLFAAPHVWWALGVPAGFPGGEQTYSLFMANPWRFAVDVIVIGLCVVGARVAQALRRPRSRGVGRWAPRTAAWIACGILSTRGLAGLAADGASDLIWWPAFLVGGMLFGSLAWLAREPSAGAHVHASRHVHLVPR
jgi:hypothetical protein